MALRFLSRLGCLSAASSVGLAAYGAHGLQKKPNYDESMKKRWDLANQHHMTHSIGLILAGSPIFTNRILAGSAAGLMLTGTVFFSGSLYALVANDNVDLRFLMPAGGTMMIASWVLLALAL
eukprot:TRINITY_DN13150_c0_g1_i2.p1 TRINITY_DN13150_c0_g1~~TRINITY_DN13150_c0_g1_i2.p1  ORF type:complete len:122 (-),score=42.34 TRINITY_DN13150_c0_g1_i2:112-477(-)